MNGMPTRLVNQLNEAGSDSIDLLEVEFEQKVELDNSSEILDTKLSDNVSKDLLKEYEDDYTLNLTLQTTVGLHVNDIRKKIDAAMIAQLEMFDIVGCQMIWINSSIGDVSQLLKELNHAHD